MRGILFNITAMKNDLSSIRFNSSQLKLNNWSLLEARGKDCAKFFQGQFTNDLELLSIGEGQLTTRLNRTGKIQSFFFIGRMEESFLILACDELVESLLDDLNKYIVMDDVILQRRNENVFILFNNFLLEEDKKETLFTLKFYGINGVLKKKQTAGVPFVDAKKLEEVRILNGYPSWKKDIRETSFLNETYLNEIAISYTKGCFLGQETVAKIENNRGPAYYPVLIDLLSDEKSLLSELYIEGKKAGVVNYQIDHYLHVNLFRDYRVEGKEIEFVVGATKFKGRVSLLPYFKNQTRAEIAKELFFLGTDEFQKGDIKLAVEYLKRAINFNPEFSDAYESIGVIMGREGKYREAIEWMDKLLLVKNSSVMAHTNKSLFFMKLGLIPEAEAEKALATVKSFSHFGEESRQKKREEMEKTKREEELNRREKMFLEVLDIDPEDVVALFGIADIFFSRKEYPLAILNLKKVIEADEKYSVAYLLLGKCQEAMGFPREAATTYRVGIEVASKKGDMMPANEMQARLNQLVMGSRLL